MLDEKQILAVVPARGGSKGIHRKNLRPVFGVPLVVRAANIARSSHIIDRRIVSTDDPEIAALSVSHGLDAPFLRPENLSGDCISDHQVLIHSLLEVEKIDNLIYDIVVMLQPTSPRRSVEDVHKAVQLLIDSEFDSVWSVSKTDYKYHPLKQLILQEDKLSCWDDSGSKIIARQQLYPTYHRNGAVYAFTRECLVEKNSIMGDRCGSIVIDGFHISIDTEADIKLLELYHSLESARN